MALTQNGQAQVSIAIVDKEAKARTFSFLVSAAAAFTVIETFITAEVIPAVQGLINGAVVGWNVTYSASDADITTASVSEASEVQRKLVFQFVAANKQKMKVEIPSVDSSHIVDGTEVVLLTDPAVIAFADLFLTTSGGAARPMTNTGSTLSSLYGVPYKMHRGSAKG